MCVSKFLQLYASQINSVALEAKIYYQIKFLTEFIALSLTEHSFSHLLLGLSPICGILHTQYLP